MLVNCWIARNLRKNEDGVGMVWYGKVLICFVELCVLSYGGRGVRCLLLFVEEE